MLRARRLAGDDNQWDSMPVIKISPKLDAWIRAEIHKLTVDTRPLEEVLVGIDTFECLVEATITDKEHALDLMSVKQVLAQLRLTRAVELKADALLAKDLFDRAVSLGFSGSDDKGAAAALLSRICLARGRPDLLSDGVEEALEESRKMDPAYESLVKRVRQARRIG